MYLIFFLIVLTLTTGPGDFTIAWAILLRSGTLGFVILVVRDVPAGNMPWKRNNN